MCLQNPFTFPIVGERLELLKAGDRSEWAQLIDQESPALRGYIMSLLWRRTDRPTVADDALQETWLLLLRKVNKSYAPKTLERVYLFVQALGAATTIMRSRKYAQGLGAIDPDHDALNSVEARVIASGLELEEAFELLGAHIKSLPDRARMIVSMRALDELTFAEIAQQLGMPFGTVVGVFNRTIKKLQEELGDESGKGT